MTGSNQHEHRVAPPDPAPPEWLPRHPEFFWTAAPELNSRSLRFDADARSVLEGLGAPPFEKSGFPLIGLLATIYDHVSEHAGSSRSQR